MAVFCCALGCPNNDRAPSEDTPTSSASQSASASPASTPRGDKSAAPEPHPAPTHPYVGGNWSACTDGFRASDHPQRDITRLTLLCAPYQGMARLGRTWIEEVSERQAGRMFFRLARGQCARVFATTKSSVVGWKLRVFSPTGDFIGHSKAHAGYAIANPDGAFCVDHTGDYRAEIHVQRGSGLVAVEVWTLPPP